MVPIGIKINNEFYSFHSDAWVKIVSKFRKKSQWYTNGKEDVFCIEKPKGFKIGKSKLNQLVDYVDQENEINAMPVTNVSVEDEDTFEEYDTDF